MSGRRMRRIRSLLGGAVVLTGLAVAMPASSAIGGFTPAEFRSVDARDGGVVIDVFASEPPGESAQVTIDGAAYDATVEPLTDSGVPTAGIIVIDNSDTALNGTVQLAKESVASMAPGEGSFVEAGLVSTAGGAKTSVKLTTNASAVTQSADALVRGGTSSLWDGIWLGGELLSDSGPAQRNLVVIAGSADGGSTNTYSSALASMRTYGVTPHVIAVSGTTVNAAELEQWAQAAGGTFQTGPDTEIEAMVAAVNERVAGQYRYTVVEPPVIEGEFASLQADISGDELVASFRPGITSTGPDALAFVDTETGSGGFFGSGLIRFVIAIFGALAVGGMVMAVGLLAMKRNDNLQFALRHYDETYGVVGVEGDVEDDSLANTAFLKRAVEVTGGIAERGGMLARVEAALERADLPLRAAEALFFYLAAAGISAVLALVLTGNILVVLVVAVISAILPSAIINFLANRRKKKFNGLLPDMLHLLAGTLRAGYSISQGFEAVSTEIEEPMGKELRRAVTEARLGRPLEQALESVALRMQSDDFEWAVMAIRIQREVGGNLAELLLTVADTMTERERLRRDVLSLTAEGRMSAIILGFLPPGLGVVMYVMNTEYVSKLFSGPGLFLLIGAAILMVIGFLWMKKTITIEV